MFFFYLPDVIESSQPRIPTPTHLRGQVCDAKPHSPLGVCELPHLYMVYYISVLCGGGATSSPVCVGRAPVLTDERSQSLTGERSVDGRSR